MESNDCNALFDKVMQLMNKGYMVSFNLEPMYAPSKVLKIHLNKSEKHHVELVDISIQPVDHLISRALHKAEWEFEYEYDF